jgi:HlyD family secretion protein
VGGTLLFGYSIIALFVLIVVGWAGTAPLESAAIAPGQISIDTNRKAVQHLEGGIVSKILVREGDPVTLGQPLVELDDIAPRTKISNLKAQLEADERQVKLVIQEETSLEALYKKGLTQLPRLLLVQRRRAELEGGIAQARSQLKAAEEVLSRTIVRAPISGTVVALQVHTGGGVISPGATLMDIVPGAEPLVAEVRLDPNHAL